VCLVLLPRSLLRFSVLLTFASSSSCQKLEISEERERQAGKRRKDNTNLETGVPRRDDMKEQKLQHNLFKVLNKENENEL
jgi:hypothetical protein